MKKALSVLLILATILSLALSLSACDALDSLISDSLGSPEDDASDTSYSCRSEGDELVFTPGSKYTKLDRGSYVELYFDQYCVMIDPIAFSTITPNEGYAFPTLEEFFGYIVLKEGDVYEADGDLIYVDQSTDETINYSFFFESANSFWWVQCTVSAEHTTPEEALTKFKEWANNITITNAEE